MSRRVGQRAFFPALAGVGAVYFAVGVWVFSLSGRYALLVLGGAVLALTWLSRRRHQEHAKT